MEEIIEKWYEISLMDMINLIKENKLSSNCLKHVPLTNFNIHYIYSSRNGLISVISSITNNFTVKGKICAENDLEYYLQVTNAHNYPNAKLRFRVNILEETNNFISIQN